MGDDYMSALDEILASTEAPTVNQGMGVQQPPPQQQQQMQIKSAKEMLGDRLRTQMGGEKRKLEDPSNGSELMSKTQKMDSDLDAAASAATVGQGIQGSNGGLDLKQDEAMNSGNGQKLLAKALMEKRPPPGSAASMGMGGMGMKQPPSDKVLLRRLSELHKEQKHEEIKSLLNEHPQLMQKMKMHQQQQQQHLQQQQQQQQQGMNRMNNNMMTNDNMIMNNDSFYGGPNNIGPQGSRIAMQQQPHPRQNMGGQWGGPPPGGPVPNGNMCQNPAMYNQHKMGMRGPQPQRGNFFNDGGPPPNAWVQPNDHPNKMMSNGPPPAYYNRNSCQPRPPMMRAGSYESFNGGQMYHGGPPPPPGGPPGGPPQGGNMRGNYHPNMDPYVNSRFGSPNNVNPPIFSPNNGGNGGANGGTNDSMHSLRMSANFPSDFNAGPPHNGYNNEFVPNAGAGNVPNNFNNPNRMRPGGNFVNQNMVSPMYNRVNIPQSSPMNEMNNMGFQPQQQPQQQQQQPTPQLQQQQQQHFMNGNFDPNFPSLPHANGNTNGLDPSFGDLANGGTLNSMANELINTETEWKSRAGDVRQTLLSKLKEALTSQNYPNAIEMAENYEERSFINANSLQDYQYKLVEWLACIYDNSASNPNVKNSEFKSLNSPLMGPDSSTIGNLAEVTTSSGSGTSPKTTEINSDSGLLEAVSKDDLLATPKSEHGSTSCLSPSLTSPQASPANSTSAVITTAPGNSGTSTTSSTTFQCPVPPSQQSEINDKSSVTTSVASSSMASSVTASSAPRPSVTSSQNGQNQPQQPQQTTRRISGSGSMQQPNGTGIPISSIGNNPQSVDSGIGLGSPRSITSGSSSTLYSPKIQGTSPSLLNSDNSPEKASNSS